MEEATKLAVEGGMVVFERNASHLISGDLADIKDSPMQASSHDIESDFSIVDQFVNLHPRISTPLLDSIVRLKHTKLDTQLNDVELREISKEVIKTRKESYVSGNKRDVKVSIVFVTLTHHFALPGIPSGHGRHTLS